MARANGVVAWVTAGALLLTVACELGSVSGRSGTDWDGDADGISDAIELNNRNGRYHPFHVDSYDANPSRPVGSFNGGSLDGGINLPDLGVGYRHYRGTDPVDGDDWAVLETMSCIEAVGRAWRENGPRTLVNVTDMSMRSGGRFPPHRSHQNGLDVDVRYVRADGIDGPVDVNLSPDLIDAAASRVLIDLFLHECPVLLILADLEALQLEPGDARLVHDEGHGNHFHVRICTDEVPDAACPSS